MRILVTGVAGFIGFHTAISLLKKGHIVYGIDNLSNFREIKGLRLKSLTVFKRFKFHKLDLNNISALRNSIKSREVDLVYHFASKTSIIPSIRMPLKYINGNISSTVNLCVVLNESGIKNIIFSSSSSVYGNAPLPFQERYTDLRPLNPYGITKLAVEKLLYYHHYMHGMNITILRYFNVYGSMGRPDMSIDIFIKGILNGRKITIYGDGEQRRDFTYIGDVINANLLALKDIKGFKIFNIASGRNYSINELISAIERLTNKKAKLVYQKANMYEARNTLGDIRAAGMLLGYEPTTDLQDGLRRVLDSYHTERDVLK